MAGVARFALLGCGRVSSRHVDALVNKSRGCRIVAVCDTIAERAQAYARQLGVPAFTNAGEMYGAVPIDVVDIATPSGLHADHTLEALEHGLNVVVEKPIALRLDDAMRVSDAARARDLKVWVAHQNRYNPALIAARRALASGRLGRLVVATIRLRWFRDQGYYDQDDWHGTWAMDGGVLSQQAVHHVDALRWLGGEIESVEAQCATRLARMECEDTVVGTVRFASGALGAVEAMTSARPADLEASVSLLGEHGSIVVGGIAMNKIEHWQFTHPAEGDDHVIEENSIEVPNGYGFGHDELFTRVSASILEGAPVEIPADEGLRTLQLLHAFYASDEQGCRVRLADRPESSRLGVMTPGHGRLKPAALRPQTR